MPPSDSEHSLSANALEQLANVVEAFDRAWRAGTPQLEDFLGRVAEPDEQCDGAETAALRAALFSALLGVEIEYRRRRGEAPQPADYWNRFPDDVRRIEVACLSESEREKIELVTRALEGGTPSIRAEGTSMGTGAVQVARLGPYIIERELGRGGMGVVYLARRPGTSDRVAVKTLLPPCGAEVAIRFRREALAMSKIDSDHVVKIYAVDEDAGRPYLVMPFVEGGQLQDLIATGPLLGTQAARLLEPVARALGELHRQGVLHRDLKPSNILYDRVRDRALLTDFGLAKLDQPDFEQTQAGAAFGTPSYMAPEQTRDAAKVTVAADIYGLGATLYHLITGRKPFHAATNIVDLTRMIREVDPPPARSVQPAVSRDLDAICQKCLEKKVEQRYRSADELADELRAFLDGRPVLARPVSTMTRLARWCDRNRLATALVSVVMLGLCLTSGLLISTLLAFGRERAAMEQELKTASVLKTTNAELEREFIKTRQLTNEAEGGQYDLILDRAWRARREARFGDLRRAGVIAPASQVGWELRRLLYESTVLGPNLVASLGEHDGPVLDAVLSPDARRLVTCGAEGLVQVWNMQTNRAVNVLFEGRWADEPRHRLHLLLDWPRDQAWPPPLLCPVDLEWLGATNSIAAASLDGQGVLIDVTSGETKTLVRDSDSLYCVAAHIDATRVLFGHRSGRLSLCDSSIEERPVHQTTLASPALALQFVAGAGWLAGCEDGRVVLLDPERLEVLAETMLTGPVWSVDAAVVEDRLLIVVGSQQPRLRVYELSHHEAPSFRLIDVFEVPSSDDEPTTAIHSVRFDASAREVCAVDQRGRVLVWSRDEQRLRWMTAPNRAAAQQQHAEQANVRGWPYPKPLERAGGIAAYRQFGLDQPLEAIHCSPEFVTRRLAWQPHPGRTRLTVPNEPRIAFDPDRPDRLWCLSGDGRLSLIDSNSSRKIHSVEAHAGVGHALVPDPQRNEFLTVGEDGVLRSWRADTDGQLSRGELQISHESPLLSVAVHPEGTSVASVDGTGTLLVWSLPTGRLAHRSALSPTAGRPGTGRIAFDLTGRRLAAFGATDSLVVFHTDPFARIEMPFVDVHGAGTAIAWSNRDPDILFAADEGNRLMIRNVEERVRIPAAVGNWRQPCVAIASTPDRRRQLILTAEGRVDVLDARRYRKLCDFMAEPGAACDLAIDANGQRVAVAFRDGRLDVWETQRSGSSSAQSQPRSTPDHWIAKTLWTASHPVIELSERAVSIGERGRVSWLALRGQSSIDELVFCEETETGVREEVVQTSGLKLSTASYALAHEANGQPVAVYRGGHDPTGQRRHMFSFDLLVSRRNLKGLWETESTGLVGNVGRYPQPIIRDGRLERIVCYCEDGRSLVDVSHSEQGWHPCSLRGRQGDGVGLQGGASTDRPVFTFNSRPGGATPGVFFAGWFDGPHWRREVADPSSTGFVASACLPDGTPVVLTRRSDQFWLATRIAENDWRSEPAPGFGVVSNSLCVDRHGLVRLLGYHEDAHQLVLWERREAGWVETVIDRSIDLNSGWATLKLDAQDHPLIVATNYVARPAWLRTYRPRTRDVE